MVGLQTLDLAIGVRVPASQPQTQYGNSPGGQDTSTSPIRILAGQVTGLRITIIRANARRVVKRA